MKIIIMTSLVVLFLATAAALYNGLSERSLDDTIAAQQFRRLQKALSRAYSPFGRDGDQGDDDGNGHGDYDKLKLQPVRKPSWLRTASPSSESLTLLLTSLVVASISNKTI